jgi:aspartate/methionine/tyrosine aminotransferase
VAEAERLGVVVAAGRVFAVEGGLEHFVRIPWTRPADELETAVDRLAEAWERVGHGRGGDGEAADRLTVA